MKELDAALAAEGTERITWLEKAWSACPHPEIADLILLADPRDFPLQGASLADTEANIARVAGRDDPRVSAAQAALLAALPFTSDSSKPLWTAFFQSLRDPRFIMMDADIFQVRASMQRWLSGRFAEARARITGTLPDPPDPERIAKLRQAIAPPAPRDGAQLLAAIYARPEDDRPRAVYADWLTEQGDPRGEFIALQLAGEEKRSKKLLKGNELAWAGPIADALAKKGLVYERGFVARAHTKFKNPKVAADLGDDPAWATLVEILGVHTAYEYGTSHHTNHVGPAFRGLRILRVIEVGGVLKLAATPDWGIEHLEVDLGNPETVDAMASLSTLPELHTLVLTRVRANPKWLWGCPFVPTLRDLTVDFVDPRILVDAQGTGLERVTFRTHRGSATFTRDGSGRFVCTAQDRDAEEILGVLGGTAVATHAQRDMASDLALSPDGTRLAIARGPRIQIVDAETLAPLYDIEDVEPAHRAVFNRAGTEIASFSRNGMYVSVFDAATGALKRRYHSRQTITAVDWTPDDEVVWVGPTSIEGRELKTPNARGVVALDDGWLALAGSGQVSFVPTSGRASRAPIPCGTGLLSAMAARGDLVATFLGTTVSLFRLSDGALLWEQDGGKFGYTLKFLGDDRLAVRSEGWRVLDLEGNEITRFGRDTWGLDGRDGVIWSVTDAGQLFRT